MTTHSAAPGTPQTALKAHVAGAAVALATMLITYVTGYLGMGEAASTALVNEGVGFVEAAVASVMTGAAAWLSAYLTPNSPKE